MATTLNARGQVTIPKRIRDALGIKPGAAVDFEFNGAGEVVLRWSVNKRQRMEDRFEAARGKADLRWRTADLMAVLRGEV